MKTLSLFMFCLCCLFTIQTNAQEYPDTITNHVYRKEKVYPCRIVKINDKRVCFISPNKRGREKLYIGKSRKQNNVVQHSIKPSEADLKRLKRRYWLLSLDAVVASAGLAFEIWFFVVLSRW